MALNDAATPFAQAMDPTDRLDFTMVVYQAAAGASPPPLLVLGEAIASYSLALTPEAVAVGLTILTEAPYAPALVQNKVTFWCEVAPSLRASPAFDGSGVTVGVEFTFTTSAVPPRRFQRTAGIRIVNQ